MTALLPINSLFDAASHREMYIDNCCSGVVAIFDENGHDAAGDAGIAGEPCSCGVCETYRAGEVAMVRKKLLHFLAARKKDAIYGEYRIKMTEGVTAKIFDMIVRVCQCPASKRSSIMRAVKMLRTHADIERMSRGTL